MSTNSSIIVMHPVSGMYASVYCHSDGYLEHNGVLLKQCFGTLEDAVALISLGDLSYLGNSYETALSYYRWREEPIRINVSTVLSDHDQHEYNYLFRDGEWHAKHTNNVWHPLATLVDKMPMPRVADTSDRWDGKTRYFPPNFSVSLLEVWATT